MVKKLLLAGVLIGIFAAGALVYLYLKPTAAASAPIEAIPLTAATPTAIPTQPARTAAATIEVVSPTETLPAAGSITASSPRIFEIIPEKSKAVFVIDEVLNGSPKTVIGETNQVSGQISIDSTTPANTQVGIIQVNTRTLTTDNEFRNRAIKNRILLTDQYEYVSFQPIEITGLPTQVTLGQTFPFQITGNLTVRDITQQVTFDAQVTPISENEIQGQAATKVSYSDYGIVIPNVSSVTGVSDEVTLTIEFTAAAR